MPALVRVLPLSTPLNLPSVAWLSASPVRAAVANERYSTSSKAYTGNRHRHTRRRAIRPLRATRCASSQNPHTQIVHERVAKNSFWREHRQYTPRANACEKIPARTNTAWVIWSCNPPRAALARTGTAPVARLHAARPNRKSYYWTSQNRVSR